MRYIALDINIGLIGFQAVAPERISFQEKVVQLVYTPTETVDRLGMRNSLALDYDHVDDQPAFIGSLINEALNSANVAAAVIDLLLIDFTSNAYDLIRDPLLISLAEKIESLYLQKQVRKFLVLLPQLPGLEMASIKRFSSIVESHSPTPHLTILSNAGSSYVFSSDRTKRVDLQTIEKRYLSIQKELDENPEKRLRQKLIRRLGHFRRTRHGQPCRTISYVTDNCEEELSVLLDIWWSKNGMSAETILHDTKNNPTFSTALIAFAMRNELKCYRIGDVLAQRRLAREVRGQNCIVAVDVIETGETFVEIAKLLKQRDINLSNKVLAVINKGGNSESKLGDFEISSFLGVDSRTELGDCKQCELNLPFTSDGTETYSTLRSFDLWFMARQVGWHKEPEYPDNIGYPYPLIPVFPKMLSMFGDWIAYKMHRILSQRNHPQNLFVIHPDEPGATSVSDKLRLRFNNLIIVKVPRSEIKAAQISKDSWTEVLTKNADADWVKQLASLSKTSALVTDVFNASGSTFLSLYKLLNHFSIMPYCYFPFVDRDCGTSSEEKYPIPKFSLYDWYGPRELYLNESKNEP